jgi:hypothetical protein
MSCHPPTRQVGPYQSEDGPHDEPTEPLALTDLHIKPYAKRHMKVYADNSRRSAAPSRARALAIAGVEGTPEPLLPAAGPHRQEDSQRGSQ